MPVRPSDAEYEIINAILNRPTSAQQVANSRAEVERAMREDRDKREKNVSKKTNPVYAKCISCQYTTFLEIEPQLTCNFNCPKCNAQFQIPGTWRPKEIMFLEIKDTFIVPYLCATKPAKNTPLFFAIWNFLAKVYPDIKNYVEYGYFRYFTPTQFSAVITNDPEVLAFEENEKATTALLSKIRSFDYDVITPEPENIEDALVEFKIALKSIETGNGKDRTPEVRTTRRSDPIGDLETN